MRRWLKRAIVAAAMRGLLPERFADYLVGKYFKHD
jgi:hypothetical protein